jgi:flagellar protein FlgJ
MVKEMTPKEFVTKYLPFANITERKSGISAIAILAQAAVESGWGSVAPGNMFFGVKDTDGINGNEQLLTTTEYHSDATHKYPQILGITPIVLNGKRLFKYRIKDWFRKYSTPEECFTDHANFFLRNPRYKNAVAYGKNPYSFVELIAKAGYATDPNYAKTLTAVIKMIEKETK